MSGAVPMLDEALALCDPHGRAASRFARRIDAAMRHEQHAVIIEVLIEAIIAALASAPEENRVAVANGVADRIRARAAETLT